ncbi:GNAT family N-acetyltransferase [Roseateles sp. DAIF2]|uniref:GNAT family N-acetyltransferase n=1 Tax=Roseateles sp. DAIF2 TaxID=2714952 RepID=UPI0018A28E86|nr:GNAT family N-acetyltransferase [Roseateles sp. DAIF2]QPF75122.1 GNAT family N-acetyltransferase [Roseateles sp. DAIF2]
MAQNHIPTLDPSTLSLGWQTELIFARFDGLVQPRPDCLVIRTPGNPLFYWGNCLVLPRPPRDAELAHWLDRFEAEVGRHTRESGHVAIGFDATAPHEPLTAWQAAGFEIFGTAQLSLEAPAERPAPLPPGFRFAPLDLARPEQLEAAVAQQCASNDMGYEPAGYRRHRERQMQRYAAMQAAGLGHWFGIWSEAEGALVADCGLFRDGTTGLGRFQHVGTHPDWRRRGLCTALIDAVGRHGLQRLGLGTLVMCADPDDVAIGIYESLGYRRRGMHWGAQRRPARDQRA